MAHLLIYTSWVNYRSCFSIPIRSILELLGSSSKSTVVHHPSVQLHHSSVLFCTICQHSSAPFVSSVLHHASATVLHHSSVTLHHSSVLFCTICQHSSAPFVSSGCTIYQFSSAPFVSYCSAPFIGYYSAPFVSSFCTLR